MLQITTISKARNNLSNLVRSVRKTKQPVVILQDSVPSAILYPYEPQTKTPYADTLLGISGSWFSEKEQTALRSEVEKRLKQS